MKTATSLSKIALHKFKRSFWGVFSFSFLFLCLLIAIFAYAIAPDNSQNANQMHLSIHSKSPGFKTKMLIIPVKVEEGNRISEFFFGKKNADTELPISGYVLKDGYLQTTDYTSDGSEGLEKDFPLSSFPKAKTVDEIPKLYISEKKFLLGTDKYGRDLLSRMLIGIRISLAIGFVAVFISLLIGISMGAIAGYFGGKIDAAIMWIINVTVHTYFAFSNSDYTGSGKGFLAGIYRRWINDVG